MPRKSTSNNSLLSNESVRYGYSRATRLFLLVPVALASISILVTSQAYAYTSPGKATGYVNDFAQTLTVSTALDLEAKLKSLQETTGDQVAVVIVKSLEGDTIENYASKLFQEWGIGDETNDNGILILVSPLDREARIEVGYGLEGTVTDLQSGNIIRKVMIPAFREGDYDAGVSGAVTAISDIITGSADAMQYSEPAPTNALSNGGFDPIAIFFFVVIFFNILAKILGKTKSWWLGGVLGAIVGGIIGIFTGFIPIGIILVIVLTVLGLVFDYFISKHPPSSGSHGGFWPIFLGGGRGGMGGGGFGGFGGGMSGGGGASGRW